MPEEKPPKVQHVLGLDLGQSADPSALIVGERIGEPADYKVRWMKRWPLGTTYPEIVADVNEVASRKGLVDPVLVVDQTGVGRPVVDLFRLECPIPVTPVTITAGSTVTWTDSGAIHVPKKDIVGCLLTLFGYRRLEIAKRLELAAVLQAELENFRVKVTAAANETFSAWRDGDHDDLVLALGLLCWVGENGFLGSIPLPPPAARSEMSKLLQGMDVPGIDEDGNFDWGRM